MNNTNTARFIRFNAKCKACGAGHSVLAAQTGKVVELPEARAHANVWQRGACVFVDAEGFAHLCGSEGIMRTCSCGRDLYLQPVIGKYRADKKCDARCTHATGHSCECSCGGKNHGAYNA